MYVNIDTWGTVMPLLNRADASTGQSVIGEVGCGSLDLSTLNQIRSRIAAAGNHRSSNCVPPKRKEGVLAIHPRRPATLKTKPKGYDPWRRAGDMDLLNSDYPFAATALQGKHAFVCGASKGIGEATAKMMAKAGADITVCARNGDALTALCEELGELGSGRHQALMLDLEDTDVLASAFASAAETLGPVHILINNAGGPPGGPLLDNEVADFDAPFRRHLHAAHTLVKAAVPSMEAEGYGRIIQIISTSVKEPIPNIGLSNTLRGAMASWAKSMSNELAPCITINNVLPGFTDTERLGSLSASIQERTGKSAKAVREGWMNQVPIGRLIDPLETASAIAYLCMPASGGIRGISLAVDGGRLRSI